MLRRNQKGFTIVEVMIVLAIAGVIMLIVFLAVPGLQRSSRNTQRKEDASHLLAAVSDYVSNNNGDFPTAVSNTTGSSVYALCSGSDSAPTNCGGQFTFSAFSGMQRFPVGTTTVFTLTDANTIYLFLGDSCNSGQGEPTTGTSSRDYAVWYGLENGTSTPTEQCTSS